MSIGTESKVVVSKTTPPKQNLQKIELSSKGKLILSQRLQAEIEYLHKKVGSIEWIGTLLYKKLEGDISDPSSLVIMADRLFLMDIGTSGHTEATIDSEEILNMWDQIPEMFELKQGLIHTHHTMAAFFSGEDWSELNDNVGLHNYYLSLVVNFAGSYVAKIAYVAEESREFKFKNSEDVAVSKKNTNNVMVVMDMDIYRENMVVEEQFEERYDYIKDKVAKAKAAKTVYVGYPLNSYSLGKTYNHTSGRWEEATSGGHWKGNVYVPDEEDALGGEALVQGELGLEEESPQENFRKNTSNPKKSKEGPNTNGSWNTLPQYQARDILLSWLNLGLEIESTGRAISQFRTITEGLRYYTYTFAEDGFESNYRYFINCMQKALVEVTEDYSPLLISKMIPEVITQYTYDAETKKIATDLKEVAEAHSLYLRIVREAQAKKEKR